jgi:hypothetical protein
MPRLVDAGLLTLHGGNGALLGIGGSAGVLRVYAVAPRVRLWGKGQDEGEK